MGEGLLTRDLVLTGSVLVERGIDLPPDLYFWASAGRTTAQPAFGARGVALANRPDLLLDSLIGSGAIYPVFPARVLRDFPRTGQTTEIVDGSFAHRSPVEAAVLWGATHIILIQADPDELMPRGSFGANIAAALTHLYDQAQLTDVRTREQAMLFNLAPRPPHIGLLDFASNLIDASLAKGYREVRGDHDRGAPQPPPFRKEVGVPHFVVLPAPEATPGDRATDRSAAPTGRRRPDQQRHDDPGEDVHRVVRPEDDHRGRLEDRDEQAEHGGAPEPQPADLEAAPHRDRRVTGEEEVGGDAVGHEQRGTPGIPPDHPVGRRQGRESPAWPAGARR